MSKFECPHCGERCNIRTSRPQSRITRELHFQCRDIECGHTFVCHLEAVRTISPSAKPNPDIFLPIVGGRKIKDQVSLTKTDGNAYCTTLEITAKERQQADTKPKPKAAHFTIPQQDPILQALHTY